MNVQEVLLSRGNEFEYALVSVGDAIEVVYFTRYEIDGEVFYLESPCYLEEIHQFAENDDIEKECITLVEDMLDDDVDRHRFFVEHLKPCIVDNTLFEILTPQMAPYLPKETDDMVFMTEEECVKYIVGTRNRNLLLAKYKLDWINNYENPKLSEEVCNFVRFNCDVLQIPYVENVSFIDDAEFTIRFGEAQAIIYLNRCDSSKADIYMRSSKLSDIVDCFNNLAHEIRHYYQRIKYVDKMEAKEFHYINEIDAMAYAHFMVLFLLGYHLRCENCIDKSIDKSIEDINADEATRLEQLVPELMQRINTMIGECL